MISDYKKVFVESNRLEYTINEIIDGEPVFTQSELKFIEEKKLLTKVGDQFKVSFVGELITPDSKFFSLPKNFDITDDNINIFKDVLKNYTGNSLLTNNTFSITKSGIKSEKFFYNELKYYFLDYITYEFIYPKKTMLKHSTSPITGGKLDVQSTMRYRKQKGPGITYKVKDILNNEDWKIDDIYWSVIDYLADKYNNRTEIDEMKDFLDSEGYIINKIDISNSKEMISEINKCDVGIIHNPIKSILLSYFESTTVGESYKINAFYTDKFQYVWEDLVRKCLKDTKSNPNSVEFKKSLSDKFNRKETRRKWFSDKEELDKFVSDANKSRTIVKTIREEKLGLGIRLHYEIDLRSVPDVFSDYNGKKFIGDAKYYQDPENADFEKEFKTYNTITENKYPMVVFVPSKRTRVLHTRTEGEFELIIFHISASQAIKDAVKNENETIDRVQALIYKNTERKGDDYLGGF
jgi:hypothetical protein